MLEYIVIIGSLVQLFGSIAYIKDTIQGKIQPNRVSFIMWSISPLIGSAAAFADGVRWAVLPVFFNGLTPIIILGVSFLNSKAYWKLEKIDYFVDYSLY